MALTALRVDVVVPGQLVQGDTMELADDLCRVFQDMRLSRDIQQLLEQKEPEQAKSFSRLLAALDSIARLFIQEGESEVLLGDALFLSYNLALLRKRQYQRVSPGAQSIEEQEAYQRELNEFAARLGKIAFALEHPETIKDLPPDVADAIRSLMKQQHVLTDMLAGLPLQGTLEKLEPVGDLKGQYLPRDWADDPTQPTAFLKN
jgi:hypothetical protein